MQKHPKLTRHNTQWAAQFETAAELTKRGFTVSFTMGQSTPVADLLAMSPSGAMCSIDVKGQSNKSYWIIKPKPKTAGLHYVLCLVQVSQRSRFFVLTQDEVTALSDAQASRATKHDPRFSGFNWGTAIAFEERWEKIPQ